MAEPATAPLAVATDAAPRPSGSPGSPGVTELKVRFHELDPNGHVNHGVYLGYLETARIELLERLGFTPGTLAARGVHLVIVEVRLRFRRPAVAGDRLRIETEVVELRRASSWWHQRLLRDGELLAEAEIRSSATDRDGRPIRPPEDLLAALRTCQP
jgi:acyl-CoA thioester hydrolase